ncbi:DUF3887 domain-containing protein [Alkalisalibacterium limincola]|uniref:DUF3887 domain-containing protein n=1 Tax=Alkalisalibacterium limincola TaxID=2699169 RepID=A0A5C8KN77_9GAMM|nr:DUF3887 domain-containing protein [Alkalisalibacterium limincola]TXK62123.1 DUF3887 domain-containing protein [Alkalisalibacterium limincola]
MKIGKHLSALLAAVALLAMPALAPADESEQATRESRAVAVLDALDEGRHEDARAHFNAQMREALDAETLEATWTSLPARMGSFQGRGEPRHQRMGGYEVVIIPLTYGSPLQANVAFDANGEIAGFHIVPATPVPATE